MSENWYDGMSKEKAFAFRARAEREHELEQVSKQVPVPRSGIPEPGPSSVFQDVTDMANAAGSMVKKSALPTIGSYALPAAATALFPPAAPFMPILRGVGSGLGEVANQALGITEPSMKQIGLSTLLPMGVEAGANFLRTGSALAPALQTQAPAMATKQIAGYRAGMTPAKTLFDQATQEGITIPLDKTRGAIQGMFDTIQDATPASRKAFEAVLNETGLPSLASTTQGISPAKMQNLLADVGKLQSQAAKEGGLKANYLGKFFSALSDDLENSGAALAPARAAFKREAVLNELDDAISSAFFIKKGQGLQGEFSANKVLNMLNKTSEGTGKFFAQAMTKGEQREIKDLFGFLNTLPSLKPGAGQTFGSGQFFDRLSKAGAGAGVGGAAGFAIGGPPGAAIGGALGLAAPEVANFGSLLMQAWKMPGGRQIVRSLLTNSEGALTPQVFGTLGAFVSGQLATETKPQATMTPPNPTMLQPMGLER